MFKKLKSSMVGILVLVGLAGGVVGATIPLGTASAACGDGFLGIPAWYHGMTNEDCSIKPPVRDKDGQGLTVYIWQIALNIIDIILRLVGYVAVAFILYGGFIYMTSNGSPDRASQGMKTIINAAIGIAIAISAVAIKELLWKIMIGSPVDKDYGVYRVDATSVVSAAFNVAYVIAGAVAVIVIIISGIGYITANGNPGSITKAKQTLYAVIGLIIVMVATPLTQFIIGRL